MNTRTIVIMIATIIVASSIVIATSFWAAGPGGVVLGVFFVIALAIRVAALFNLFTLPVPIRRLTNWTMGVSLVSILAIGAAYAILHQIKGGDEEETASTVTMRTAESFVINKGQEVQTVFVDKGEGWRVASDKPFIIMDLQSDGASKEVKLNSGYNTITGRTAGLVRVRGVKNKTHLRFWK